MKNLKEFKDMLRNEAELLSRGEAFEKGICAKCQKPPKFYSEAGQREYNISGLCEYCFDEIMAEPEEKNDNDES